MTLDVLMLIVFLGAFAQSTTGVGFGVVAGPFFFQAYDYDRAIVETAIFSLLVALVSALSQYRHQKKSATMGLVATLPIGVAVGVALLWLLPKPTVILGFGVTLAWLGLVLLRQVLSPALDHSQEAGAFVQDGRLTAVGVVAGMGALLFAAPGPAAAWGLARTSMSPAEIRSTLAVYFIPAYGLILAVFAIGGLFGAAEWRIVAMALPVCLIGAATGTWAGGRLPIRPLKAAIALTVLVSGLSILRTILLAP